MIIGLHHFGMMVDNLEDQIMFYETLGFKVSKRFNYDAISAKAALLQCGKANVELWQFDNPDNEMAQKIKKHFAFATDNLDSDLEKYLKAGYKLAIPITKGKVVKRYAYVKDQNDNYIELLED